MNIYKLKRRRCKESDECDAFVHVIWCPESAEYRDYERLQWYKKMFTKHPKDY